MTLERVIESNIFKANQLGCKMIYFQISNPEN